MLGGTGVFFTPFFALDGSSTIVRNGTVEVLEDVDGEGNDPTDDDINDELVPVTLGRRRRAKIGSKKYGVEWELH